MVFSVRWINATYGTVSLHGSPENAISIELFSCHFYASMAFFGSCYRVEYHHPNQNNFFVKSPNDCLKLTASLTMLTKSSFTTLPMSWKVTEIRFELRPAIWLMATPFLMWHSQQSHYFFICIRASVDSVAGVECKKCNKMKGWAHLEFIAADTAFT